MLPAAAEALAREGRRPAATCVSSAHHCHVGIAAAPQWTAPGSTTVCKYTHNALQNDHQSLSR